MNASDKAHLRLAAGRGECTPEYAEQLIREAEQRAEQLSPTALQIPDWLMQPQIPLFRNADGTARDA